MFSEHSQHPKINCPPRSKAYIYSAFARSPSHHREPQPPHRDSPSINPTSARSIFPSRPSFLSIDPRSEEAAVLYGGIPFITRTFSHACPTRASGDANRMHSVLNTFFQAPVSGEEKKRRLRERVAGLYLSSTSSPQLMSPTKMDSRAPSKKGPLLSIYSQQSR